MARSFWILLAGLLGLGAAALFLLRAEPAPLDTSVAVSEAMAGDTTGYRRATTVRPFQFPEDHGPHPGYKTEWWYVTGNLSTANGRDVGYELTLFRIAMAPPDAPSTRRASTADPDTTAAPWATDQFYMGHFAISDVQRRVQPDAERFARAAAGLAGAQADPLRVWLGPWSIASVDSARTFPLRLRAATDTMAIDVTLRPQKPMVLQGNRGLSQKGPGRGNASYYYSYTRLATEGRVVTGGDTLAVTGLSWMDREWSTSALGANQVGWDWFALQLDSGYDLMYYQLRTASGRPSRFSEGAWVDPSAQKTSLTREEVALTVLDTWTTPDGARTYPVTWRLQVPGQQLDLTVDARFPNQELTTSVRYWEGAVRVTGTQGGVPVRGTGYVELTGYGEQTGRIAP
ncbi:lipocalin-like domain-containing protein [Salisaeta longa]|uniref:lipocalin-like domain-containing protein n=1 Tax=Salisaeta longa TaxID=503170 RepID=UPI0003B7AE85|nr:lipocalin-like domain-containing protein [Salisaeta longa]